MSKPGGTVTSQRQHSTTYKQTYTKHGKQPKQNLLKPLNDILAFNKSQSINNLNNSRSISKSVISQTRVEALNGKESRFQNSEFRVQVMPQPNMNGQSISSLHYKNQSQLRESLKQAEEQYFRNSHKFSQQLSSHHNSFNNEAQQNSQPKYSHGIYESPKVKYTKRETHFINEYKTNSKNSKFALERDIDKKQKIIKLQQELFEQRRQKQILKRQIERLKSQRQHSNDNQYISLLRARDYELSIRVERILQLQRKIEQLKKQNKFLFELAEFCKKNHIGYQQNYQDHQSTALNHVYKIFTKQNEKVIIEKSQQKTKAQNLDQQNQDLRQQLQVTIRQLEHLKIKYAQQLQKLNKSFHSHISKSKQLNDLTQNKYYQMQTQLQSKIRYLQEELIKREQYYSRQLQRTNQKSNQDPLREQIEQLRRSLNNQQRQFERLKIENENILRQKQYFKQVSQKTNNQLNIQISKCSQMEKQLQKNTESLTYLKRNLENANEKFANYQKRYNQQEQNKLKGEIQQLRQVAKKRFDDLENYKIDAQRSYYDKLQGIKKDAQAQRDRYEQEKQKDRQAFLSQKLQTINNEHDDKISNYEAQAQSLKKLIKQYQNKLNEYQQHVKKLNNDLVQKDNNIEQITSHILTCNMENQTLANRVKDTENNYEQQIKRIKDDFDKEKNNTKNQFEKQKQRLEEQNLRNQQQCEHKTNSYNQLKREKDEGIKKLKQQYERKLQDLQRRQQQLKNQHRENYTINSRRVQEILEQRNKLQSQKRQLENMLQSQRAELQDLKQKLGYLQRDNQNYQTKTNTYDKNFNTIQGRVQVLERQVQNYKETIPNLQRQIQQKNQLLYQTRYQYQNLKKSKDQKMMSNLEENRRIQQSKNNQIAQKLTTIQMLKKKLQIVEKENHQLRQGYNNHPEMNRQEEIQYYKQTLAKLTAHYRQLKNSQINQARALAQLNSKLDQTQHCVFGICNYSCNYANEQQNRNISRNYNENRVTQNEIPLLNLNKQLEQSQFQRPISKTSRKNYPSNSRKQTYKQQQTKISRRQIQQTPRRYVRQAPPIYQAYQQVNTHDIAFPVTIRVSNQSPPKITAYQYVIKNQTPVQTFHEQSRHREHHVEARNHTQNYDAGVSFGSNQTPGSYQIMRQPSSTIRRQENVITRYYCPNQNQINSPGPQHLNSPQVIKNSRISQKNYQRQRSVNIVKSSNILDSQSQRLHIPGAQFAQSSVHLPPRQSISPQRVSPLKVVYPSSPPSTAIHRTEQIRKSNARVSNIKTQNEQHISVSRALFQSPRDFSYKQPSHLNPSQFYEQRTSIIQKPQIASSQKCKTEERFSTSQIINEQQRQDQEKKIRRKSVNSNIKEQKSISNRLEGHEQMYVQEKRTVSFTDSQDSGIFIFQKDRSVPCCYTSK